MLNMNITETYKEELSCGFLVKIPYQEVADMMGGELEKLALEARLPGFRPGKVPKSIIEQRFGNSVFSDVARKMIGDTMRKLIVDNKLSPAAEPKITVDAFEKNKTIEYRLDIDLMPEIKLDDDFSKLSLDVPIIDAAKEDIDRRIDNLVARGASSKKLDAARPVKKDDIVIIDFEGRIDDTVFDGGSAKDYRLELGSGNFLPDFEKALEGAEIGKAVEALVQFPEAYQAKELAGKTAKFTMTVKEIHKKILPKLNDEFAQKLGQPNIEKLRELVKAHIERDAQPVKERVLRRQIFDFFDKNYNFTLPPRLVDNEFQALWQRYKNTKKSDQEGKAEDKEPSEAERAEFRVIAERRIRIGLVLAEIGKKHKLSVSEEELKHALQQEAARHPGQEDKIIKQYQKHPHMIENIRAPVFEDKVIAVIIEKASCVEKKMTPEMLIKFDVQQNTEEEETLKEEKAPKKKATKAKKRERQKAAPKKPSKPKEKKST